MTEEVGAGGRNSAVVALSGLATRVIEPPVVSGLPRCVERHRLGVVKLVRLPAWLEAGRAVALTHAHLWHVLTHRVPCSGAASPLGAPDQADGVMRGAPYALA